MAPAPADSPSPASLPPAHIAFLQRPLPLGPTSIDLILSVDLPRLLANPLLPPTVRDLLTRLEGELRGAQADLRTSEVTINDLDRALDRIEAERDRLLTEIDRLKSPSPGLIKPEPKVDPKTGYPPGW